MKAAVRHAFGPPELLHVEDVPTPTPGQGEIRIRVRAASVNLGDWELLTGEPRWISTLATIFAPWPKHRIPAPQAASQNAAESAPGGAAQPLPRGLFAPRFKILGTDFAGHVDAVGPNVTDYRVGDEVFGDTSSAGFGAFAEYVCVPAKAAIAPKPAGLSFEQAAAMPQAAFIAVQAIRDQGQVQPGNRVLINGAGGGAGCFALQLAKHYGAEVTAVDGAHKRAFLEGLGADHVIDYAREDFTQNGSRYDVILDLAAQRSVFDVRPSLTPGGVYLLAGGAGLPTAQSAFLGPFLRAKHGRIKFLVADSEPENLRYLIEQFEAGTFQPIIDRCFPLAEAGAALRRVGDKQSLGKVILTA